MSNSPTNLKTWSPGQRSAPVKDKPAIEPAGVANICRSLEYWFEGERPPADDITVIPESVRFVDPKFRLVKCWVRTAVWFNKVKKEHVSNVRVKVDNQFRIIPNSLSFA